MNSSLGNDLLDILASNKKYDIGNLRKRIRNEKLTDHDIKIIEKLALSYNKLDILSMIIDETYVDNEIVILSLSELYFNNIGIDFIIDHIINRVNKPLSKLDIQYLFNNIFPNKNVKDNEDIKQYIVINILNNPYFIVNIDYSSILTIEELIDSSKISKNINSGLKCMFEYCNSDRDRYEKLVLLKNIVKNKNLNKYIDKLDIDHVDI